MNCVLLVAVLCVCLWHFLPPKHKIPPTAGTDLDTIRQQEFARGTVTGIWLYPDLIGGHWPPVSYVVRIHDMSGEVFTCGGVEPALGTQVYVGNTLAETIMHWGEIIYIGIPPGPVSATGSTELWYIAAYSYVQIWVVGWLSLMGHKIFRWRRMRLQAPSSSPSQ